MDVQVGSKFFHWQIGTQLRIPNSQSLPFISNVRWEVDSKTTPCAFALSIEATSGWAFSVMITAATSVRTATATIFKWAWSVVQTNPFFAPAITHESRSEL